MVNKNYYLSAYEKAMPSSLSFEEKLNAIKEAGFDGMEISIDASDERIARLYWNKQQKDELKNAINNTQVPIKSMCLSAHRKYSLGSLDDDIRNKGLDIMKKAVEFADEIGIKIIQLAGYDVFYEKSNQETKQRFIEGIKYATTLASTKGILLGFETMDTEFINTVKKAMEYVDIVNSPYLGVYPDIGNLENAYVLYNSNLEEDIETGRGHIIAAHLKETVPGKDRDIPFGKGHTEYERSIKLLKDLGVRLFNGEFWQSSDDYLSEMKSANSFLRNKLDKIFND